MQLLKKRKNELKNLDFQQTEVVVAKIQLSVFPVKVGKTSTKLDFKLMDHS
jgi:hypothetical protein